MRQQVIDLQQMGPLPASDKVIRENMQALIDKYGNLLDSIEKPVTDDEARALVGLFGPGDCFELEWPLIHLIETAPGWPLMDCLENSDNQWVQFLKQRLVNAREDWLRARAAREPDPEMARLWLTETWPTIKKKLESEVKGKDFWR